MAAKLGEGADRTRVVVAFAGMIDEYEIIGVNPTTGGLNEVEKPSTETDTIRDERRNVSKVHTCIYDNEHTFKTDGNVREDEYEQCLECNESYREEAWRRLELSCHAYCVEGYSLCEDLPGRTVQEGFLSGLESVNTQTITRVNDSKMKKKIRQGFCMVSQDMGEKKELK